MATSKGNNEKSIKYGWFKDKKPIKIGRVNAKTTSFDKTAWSPTRFTPSFQYFYTYMPYL